MPIMERSETVRITITACQLRTIGAIIKAPLSAEDVKVSIASSPT